MRAFVCNIIPNSLIVKLKAPQAPNNFCINLIENGLFDKIISLVPPSYFDDNIKDDNVIYLNGNAKANKLVKNLKAIVNSIKAAFILKKYDSVWFYNISSSNVITYIILRFIFHIPVYAILLDYTPVSNIFSISHYVPWLFKKAHGVISLSERTNISNKNIVYKAGIISSSKIINPQFYDSKHKKLVFLFSGNLSNHTGFPLALETFKQLPQVELYISGNGDVDVEELREYPNIHYLGYMNYYEYLKLYNNIDVCLSLRNPNYEENRNNFPSKIMEYFSYGKIVLSTLEYPELKDFNYIKTSYSVDSLKECILSLINKDNIELNKYMDNQKAMLTNFSEKSWISSIEFLETKKYQ